MNRFRRWRRARQDGNAVLFSLIIMASAMTISLGMASLVVGEIHSVQLVLPSERAYYRAESYVEQALWQKKTDSTYEFNPTTNATGQVAPPVGQQLSVTYLCATAPCFSPPPPGPPTPPSDQATLLKEFSATSSLQQPAVTFPADVPQQFDIITTGTQLKDGSGTIKLDNIAGAAGYRGLEVTIIAYPTASGQLPQFPVDNKTTVVFVDKIVIPASGNGGCDSRPTPNSCNILLGASQQSAAGEPYPALDSHSVYRLRIRALGADASANLAVTNGGNNALTLRSPDFTVRSVAADTNAQRGIQVVVPAAPQVASIFDFVLFSDLDLAKLRAKAAGTKLITATVYQDQNNNCTRDVSDPPLSGLTVTAHPISGSDSTGQTGADGTVTFSNLQAGMTYSVTVTLPAGSTACTPPGNPQSAAFAANTTNEAKALTYLIKPPASPRVPLYRFYSSYYTDHFYTTTPCVSSAADKDSSCSGSSYIVGQSYFNGYVYESIPGYLYSTQVTGSIPLYRASTFNFSGKNDCQKDSNACDHLYTIDPNEYDATNLARSGYVQEGITGYVMSSQVSGTTPFYRLYSGGLVDHFYTTNRTERNNFLSDPKGGWSDQGISGYLYTGP